MLGPGEVSKQCGLQSKISAGPVDVKGLRHLTFESETMFSTRSLAVGRTRRSADGAGAKLTDVGCGACGGWGVRLNEQTRQTCRRRHQRKGR
jgi:hypothetical protein